MWGGARGIVYFDVGGQRIAVTHRTRDALFAAVGTRLADGTGFAVATLNLDHLVQLHESPAFVRAYAAHDIVVADGHPVVWMSRLARRPVSLVPGADLVVPVAALAADAGAPVALVGSTSDVLDRAGEAMRAAVPNLDIALTYAPPMGFEPQGQNGEAAIAAIRDSGARLVFLALGAPKQELLAARARPILPQVGFVSVGAGIDFLAGAQRRAPLWLRRLAFEWLWRAVNDPIRLGPRYLRCLAALPGLAVEAYAGRER